MPDVRSSSSSRRPGIASLSTPHMGTSLHSHRTDIFLPTEIFEQVVDELDRADLAMLASMSRYTSALARVRLYRQVIFNSVTPSSSVFYFMDTIRRNSSLAQLVVHLELDWTRREPEYTTNQELLHNQMSMLTRGRQHYHNQPDITRGLPLMINLEFLSFSTSIGLWHVEAGNLNFATTQLHSLHVYSTMFSDLPRASLLLLIAKQTHLAELSVPHLPNEFVDVLQGMLTLNTLRIASISDSMRGHFWDTIPTTTNGGPLENIRRLDLCSGTVLRHAAHRNEFFTLLPNLRQLNLTSLPDELAPPYMEPGQITVPTRLDRFGMIFCPDVSTKWSRSPLDALDFLAKLFPKLEQLDMLCPCADADHKALGPTLVNSNGDRLIDFVKPKMAQLQTMTMAGRAWSRYGPGHSAESFVCAPATARDDPPDLPAHMFRGWQHLTSSHLW